MFRKLDEWPAWRIAVAVGAFTALIVGFDLLTSPESAFGPALPALKLCYLPVILVAGWRLGWPTAVGLSLFAAVGGAIDFAVTAAGRQSCTADRIWTALAWFGTFSTLGVLVALLRRSDEGARQLARTDALTGLANHKLLRERAEAELNRSRRTGRPITVAFIDVDEFKTFNDARGHLDGDELLKTIAAALVANCRSYDVAARLGGDEFVLLLPETSSEAARRVIDRIHGSLLAAAKDCEPQVTFCVGVATFCEPPESAEDLIRAADELMFAVKREGKNGVKYASTAVRK